MGKPMNENQNHAVVIEPVGAEPNPHWETDTLGQALWRMPEDELAYVFDVAEQDEPRFFLQLMASAPPTVLRAIIDGVVAEAERLGRLWDCLNKVFFGGAGSADDREQALGAAIAGRTAAPGVGSVAEVEP